MFKLAGVGINVCFNTIWSDYSWSECSNGLTSSVVRRGSPAKSSTRTCDELAKKTLISGQSHTPQGIVYDIERPCEFFCVQAWRTLDQWEFQEPIDSRYLPYIRPMLGNVPTKYGLIWYSTSILGSWNSHWLEGIHLGSSVNWVLSGTLKGEKQNWCFPRHLVERSFCASLLPMDIIFWYDQTAHDWGESLPIGSDRTTLGIWINLLPHSSILKGCSLINSIQLLGYPSSWKPIPHESPQKPYGLQTRNHGTRWTPEPCVRDWKWPTTRIMHERILRTWRTRLKVDRYPLVKHSHGFSMALIEIDGWPNFKMVDSSMANC